MHIKSIEFKDSCGSVIKSFKLQSLPFREEIILQKSIEFFNDPEPCFIHRSAVITRLIAEMDDFLYTHASQGSGEIEWRDFPEKFRDMLLLGKNVAQMCCHL